MAQPHLRLVPSVQPGAVLYIRQSITRRKKDARGRATNELDTISPELQETSGRDHCARHGYPVVAVVTDLNKTGRTLHRRSVREALGYLERGEAGVIVVWKWSRLARNRRDFNITCDYVEATLGGRIESSSEPADTTTAVGRLSRGMLAEFAAFESDRIGDDFRAIHESRVQQGLPGNGRARFGYVNVEGRFVPDPETGPVLAQTYRRYLSGAGWTRIARWLNDHGHRTTYDCSWQPATVTIVLDSGFGAGLIRHRGALLPGAHDPVITAGEWKRYLALREARAKIPSRAKGSRYLLAGLIKCGLCGYAMNVRIDSTGKRWYRCRSRPSRGCPARWVQLEAVEREVFTWLRGLVEAIDQVAAANRRQDATALTAHHRAASLARRVNEQDQALTRLTVDRANGLVPDLAYVGARDEIMATRARLVEELEQAEGASRIGRIDITEYRGLVDEWDTIPVEARREALRRIIRRVSVWTHPLRVDPVPVWAPGDVAGHSKT